MIMDQQFLPHVETLVESSLDMAVRELHTSGPAVYCEDAEAADHFKLHIAYAGHTLVWEVCFDCSSPDIAPDFVFDDDSFTLFLNADLLCERAPSLVNWDVENPECLRNAVQELINLHTMYQLQRLEKEGSLLSEELSKFMQEFELNERQLQVLSGDFAVSPQFFESSSRPSHNTVSVIILQLESAFAFDGVSSLYRGMALQLTYHEYSPTAVLFHISPSLEDALGDQSEFELPNYSKAEGLSKYFHHFLKVLIETLNQVYGNLQKREEFHLGLLYELYERENITVQPLEYDFLYFTSSSYMLEVSDFPALVHFHTPKHGFSDPKISVRDISGNLYVEIETSGECSRIIEEVIDSIKELMQENCSSIG